MSFDEILERQPDIIKETRHGDFIEVLDLWISGPLLAKELSAHGLNIQAFTDTLNFYAADKVSWASVEAAGITITRRKEGGEIVGFCIGKPEWWEEE